jgi:hypothetical protein
VYFIVPDDFSDIEIFQEKSFLTEGNVFPRPNTPQNVVICSLTDITPGSPCENSQDLRHVYSVCVSCVFARTHIFIFLLSVPACTRALIVAVTNTMKNEWIYPCEWY